MADATYALVALGSNLPFGDLSPPQIVADAMDEVAALGRGARRARIWRSPAWPPGGPEYANSAMELQVDLGPEELLAALHAVEARFGRARSQRWGARTLDLDLLAWGTAVRPDDATQAAWRGLPPERQGSEAP